MWYGGTELKGTPWRRYGNRFMNHFEEYLHSKDLYTTLLMTLMKPGGGDYVSFRTRFETAAICLSASPCIPASKGQQCTGLQEPFTDRTAQHLLLEKLGENFQTSAALAWNTSSAKAQVNLVPSNSVTSQRTDPVQ